MTAPFSILAGVLRWGAEELVELARQPIGGEFKATTHSVRDLLGLTEFDPEADHWFMPNPGTGRFPGGRHGADDITRLAAIWADLDVTDPVVKPTGGFPTIETARDFIDKLARMVGAPPSLIISSGHGLQPVWPILDGGTERAGELLAAWDELVRLTADGVAVDSTGNLDRLLRLPWTVNVKDPDHPAPTDATQVPAGRPITVAELAELLEREGILARRREREQERKRRQQARAGTAGDTIDRWCRETSWGDLLTADGWEPYRPDSCGCPTWTRPDRARPGKSATAHVDEGCANGEALFGHGALQVWSSGANVPEGRYSRFSYEAFAHYGGDFTATAEALGLNSVNWDDPFFDEWNPFADGADDEPSSDRQRSSADGPADAADADGDLGGGNRQQDADQGKQRQAADGPDKDTDKGTDNVNDMAERLRRKMAAEGIPESLFGEFWNDLKKQAMRRINSELMDAGRRKVSAADRWLPTDDFADRFTTAGDGQTPTVLVRTDGTALLYPAATNYAVGRRGAGKTMLAVLATAQALTAGKRAVHVDMEDSMSRFRERLVMTAGVNPDPYVKDGSLFWVSPDGIPEPGRELDRIVGHLSTYDLVVFDTMNRLIARLGGNPDNGNEEVMRLYDELFDPITGAGSTVLILDHPNRRGQRSDATTDDLEPGGGAMKLNNLTGHALGLKVRRPFTRSDPDGQVELITLKDRGGHFPERTTVGEFRGRVTVGDTIGRELVVLPPAGGEGPSTADDIAATAAKIREVLAKVPDGLRIGLITPAVTHRLRPLVPTVLDQMVAAGELTKVGNLYALTARP